MRRAENINPEILRWARETAGLSVKEAANKLGLRPSGKKTDIEKLEALERGDTWPTRKQLLEIARVYRRPLTVFYLNKRPREAKRGEDFRTLAGPVSGREAALLDALLRDIRARQDMVSSVLEDDEDTRPLPFTGSLSISQPVIEAANRIRSALGFENDESVCQGTRSPDELFARLRNHIEQLGVFVILAGNLGSHHSNISENVFRGFAIADPIAPFIVINDQDAKSARSFTLIHELAHIFLGVTGISASPDTAVPHSTIKRIERFCNDIASEFLLPEHFLSKTGEISEYSVAQALIKNVARDFQVSEPMVAYRFWNTGRISKNTYEKLETYYTDRWQEQRQRNRERTRENDEKGPSYYIVRRHRLGQGLINLVGRMLLANELTHTKAAKMLGVKSSKVAPLMLGAELLNGPLASERR